MVVSATEPGENPAPGVSGASNASQRRSAARWEGDICCMCNGSGLDFSFITVPNGPFQLVVGRVENGRRCRACNGHGRDP